MLYKPRTATCSLFAACAILATACGAEKPAAPEEAVAQLSSALTPARTEARVQGAVAAPTPQSAGVAVADEARRVPTHDADVTSVARTAAVVGMGSGTASARQK